MTIEHTPVEPAATEPAAPNEIPPAGAPPATLTVPPPAAFQYQPTEDQAAFVPIVGEQRIEAFRDLAAKGGFTDEQYTLAMNSLFELMPELQAGAAGAPRFDPAASTAELRRSWTTDGDFDANLRAAVTAVRTYAGDDAQGLMDRYGSDPAFVKMMARMVPAASNDGRAPAISAQAYTRANWEAYSNPRNPNHAAVSREVRRLHEIEYAAKGGR